MFPPPRPSPSCALSSDWSIVVSWLDPSNPWPMSPSGTSIVTGDELLNWEPMGWPRSWGRRANRRKGVKSRTDALWDHFRPLKHLHSPFPVTTPTECFPLTGSLPPDSGAPDPVRWCWHRWRRRMGHLLPPRRYLVPRRCPRAPCPTAPRNETPHRTQWGQSPGPKRWEGSRTPHRQGWGCEMSEEEAEPKVEGRNRRRGEVEEEIRGERRQGEDAS